MATVLTDIAVEGSTFVVTCAFSDEDGISVIPNADVSWRLIDSVGAQISSGTVSPAASVDILLSGPDLSIEKPMDKLHWVTLVVSTTYDGALGDDLPMVDVVEFQVRNIFDT